jgi:hypothetical protein
VSLLLKFVKTMVSLVNFFLVFRVAVQKLIMLDTFRLRLFGLCVCSSCWGSLWRCQCDCSISFGVLFIWVPGLNRIIYKSSLSSLGLKIFFETNITMLSNLIVKPQRGRLSYFQKPGLELVIFEVK